MVFWEHVVYGLLCSAVSISNYSVDGRMTGELRWIGKNFEGRSYGQIEILSWSLHLLTEKKMNLGL